MSYVSAESKLRLLATQSVSLQAYFGSPANKFRYFDVNLPQGQIASGACMVVRRISTVWTYEQRGLQNLSQPRFQFDILAPNTVNGMSDPETGRAAADAVITWLGTVDLASNAQFGSPVTTPPQFPCFVLNQRSGLFYQLSPPVYVQSIDVRLFNLES